MSLKEKLNQERESKIIDHAIDFAENIEPKLIQSAQDGFTGYTVHLEHREDAHILRNPMFLKHIEILLEGCKAEIQKDEYTNILFKTKYYKSKLVISWV